MPALDTGFDQSTLICRDLHHGNSIKLLRSFTEVSATLEPFVKDNSKSGIGKKKDCLEMLDLQCNVNANYSCLLIAQGFFPCQVAGQCHAAILTKMGNSREELINRLSEYSKITHHSLHLVKSAKTCHSYNDTTCLNYFNQCIHIFFVIYLFFFQYTFNILILVVYFLHRSIVKILQLIRLLKDFTKMYFNPK